MKMKLAVVLFVLGVTIITLGYDALIDGHVRSDAISRYGTLQQVDPSWVRAPDISITDINDRSLSLLDLNKGSERIILINFWATWCAPCVKEIPYLLSLANDNKDELIIVLISVDKEGIDFDRFFHRFGDDGLNYSNRENVVLVHDYDRKIAEGHFQVFKFPETFLVNSNGFITNKFTTQTELEEHFNSQ